MRHLVDHRKLGRTTPQRQALLKGLAVSLIRHGRIQTTLPKAKELKRLADKLVTWGKAGTLSARRAARRFINDRDVLTKLFKELAPRFASRNGGYTRLLKLNFRYGDQAPLAFVEYLDNPVVPIKKKTPKKSK
ncbi:MAG: 50S ribosomal protein L17 [Deltaproteobacteria bacterium RIFCSPLOWO2_12_FULL_44_12]|nr:MAG: 50S ribosomal protein L17 [Deltaproteobacteria bacterium RIFCSPHIGHO2_01_FULL_43_49]OGQ14947.1 MAG: 50S ribosomal protein L17 [Deltaproteobacteria bacterium RIFCSPHIGHO2_02_FULL_44_53]OGQ29550.1 MAG: 50S ribosomal protein L17 [Deltaproteobacteria bacterium RIFCSPHIGHO2_12_FULL_44_21]OGQ31059.1 MAG: 50S ribosomal protein L17 [Deltaproteobacteria bacterium RIFCSPLOWO2_01_FULL_45_74]OGQ42661.1 MAG: 50S ribosomal protein L17 [Deltaproteobacteria bacterium RIFCSPLOWO2_02_FULL_44_34]OGQ70861